jgi:hypothetical protein
MTTSQAGKQPDVKKPARKGEWAPRIWEGCNSIAWLRLLARNRFAVHWSCWYIALIVTWVSALQTFMRYLQAAWLGDRPERTPIREAPVFIIGHWRTGTTLLHEMLIRDPRHAYPTYFECLEPNHFLLTERFLTAVFGIFMPAQRPMDNMVAGWDRPQEDEFALCLLGQPSPYLTIAFPNHPPQCQEAFDLDELTPRVRAGWKRAFLGFLSQLTYKTGKRLILKSPPHSCRIKHLLQLFPDARFVHIVRDPYVVFPSTVKLWKSLYRAHGLQRPTFAGLEEHVYHTFTHMYRKIDEGKALIKPGRFHELAYEELIRDPIGQMQMLYQRLDLGSFETLRPHLEQYLTTIKGYETNRYQLSPETRAEITRRWGAVIRQYGYEPESTPAANRQAREWATITQ